MFRAMRFLIKRISKPTIAEKTIIYIDLYSLQNVTSADINVIRPTECSIRELCLTNRTWLNDGFIFRAIHNFEIFLTQQKQILYGEQSLISDNDFVGSYQFGQSCSLRHDTKKSLNPIITDRWIMRHCSFRLNRLLITIIESLFFQFFKGCFFKSVTMYSELTICRIYLFSRGILSFKFV